jgi:sugar phosphate isomerase/epimerase
MGMARVGLQLYSVREECTRNLPATLEAASSLGYAGVEPWGYDGSDTSWMGHDGLSLRCMLDEAKLACCGMHVATQAIEGERLSRTVGLSLILGNPFVVVAADRARMSSMAGIAELAGILNRAAGLTARHGIRVGYHAHGFDFARVEGKVAWYELFGRLESEVVMQLDNGNCASGGGDPLDVLRSFPGRARTVHLKEHGGPPGSVIGEGKMDWPETFRLCETLHATEWYVVEEGEAEGRGFDVCRRSREALRRMGM